MKDKVGDKLFSKYNITIDPNAKVLCGMTLVLDLKKLYTTTAINELVVLSKIEENVFA